MSPAPKKAASPATTETAGQPAHPAPTVAESAALTQEAIARRAYQYWAARGRPIGSPEEDWYRAEQDVLMDQLVWGSATGSEVAHSSQRSSRKPRTG